MMKTPCGKNVKRILTAHLEYDDQRIYKKFIRFSLDFFHSVYYADKRQIFRERGLA